MNRKTLVFAGLLLTAGTAAMAQPGSDSEGPTFGNPSITTRSSLPTIDVAALIERLADEMDKEFVLDSRMLAMFGGTTAGADADYDTLLAILRQNGFAAIETADQILIVPDGAIRSEPSRLLQNDDRRVSDHEIVTRIIEVPGKIETGDGSEVSAAAALVPLLRPMMAQNAQLGAMPGTDKLIIVDRYDNVRRITAVIEELMR